MIFVYIIRSGKSGPALTGWSRKRSGWSSERTCYTMIRRDVCKEQIHDEKWKCWLNATFCQKLLAYSCTGKELLTITCSILFTVCAGYECVWLFSSPMFSNLAPLFLSNLECRLVSCSTFTTGFTRHCTISHVAIFTPRGGRVVHFIQRRHAKILSTDNTINGCCLRGHANGEVVNLSTAN